MPLGHYLEENLDNSNASWIDIPTPKQLAKSSYGSTSFTDDIATYHSVPKTSLIHLPERVSRLESLEVTLKSDSGAPINAKLGRMVTHKKNYLKALQRLHNVGLLMEDIEIYGESDIQSYFNCPDSNKTVMLKNQPYYDANNGRNWGEYWLEVVDPAHRLLDDYKAAWINQKENNKGIPPFFLWLEQACINPCELSCLYIAENELALHNVTTNSDGKLSYSNRDDITPIGRNLFVINEHGKIYVHPLAERLKHTSFSHGRPVIGSGLLEFDTHGNILNILFDSGHYLPTPQDAQRALRFMKDSEVSISSSTPVKFYRNFKSEFTTAHELLNGKN